MAHEDLPFAGVKVLDLSQGVAGPYCGMHFARNGADVIKLEPPGTGCWSRQLGKAIGDQTAHSVVVHRGKRSIAVDLKTTEGLEIAKKLAADCNVMIQNYRVGKLAKLGLDYGSVEADNPRVVYVAITGFGQEGPRRDQPATDSVMQAYTGMMSINRDINGLPQRINMLAIDFSTGLYAFQAAAAALYGQAVKGKGKLIETSLLESAMVFQEAAIMESHLQGGETEPIGMPVGSFKTKDGYMSINARRDPHFQKLCTLIGKEHWIDDPRFADPRSRVQNREILLSELRPIIETKTSDEWNKLISEADILNAKVQNHLDLFEDPQVLAVEALRWVENDTLGRVPMASVPGQPAAASGDQLTHSPHLGEHNAEVLTELGYLSTEIDALIEKGVVGGFVKKVAA
ncbi:MAG: Acetyl-CoA:oxalate CoA-transferase [Alphaproteobacteria bacterium MarineAlpha4_Bin2]|nr:MAG: Acetyl-CoA:oxalate CoA-transferase [Alphaproteobacteria bacterium MarineAlpha4_Bin2]